MLLTPQGASRSLAAVFTPIKSRGLVDEVCGRIEQAVETGLLTSGQRLPNETELAAALGVSAVTAREALSQLRTSGIIRTARGRNGGSFIADDVLPSRERALDQLRELTRLQISDLGLHYQAIAAACASVARPALRRRGHGYLAVLHPQHGGGSVALAAGPLRVPARGGRHRPLGQAGPGTGPLQQTSAPYAAAMRRRRIPCQDQRPSRGGRGRRRSPPAGGRGSRGESPGGRHHGLVADRAVPALLTPFLSS